MFEKVLIANRGEIALRIHRACREMGILTVAIHSTADSEAMHVRLADESVCVGPPAARDSYLNIPSIMAAAELTGASAIHPGYGFLSENAEFARIIEAHGLTLIGPKAQHIEMMGDKVAARQALAQLGIPLVPGSEGIVDSFDIAQGIAGEIGYPVLVKAVAGGGGRGMKVASSADELELEFAMARREASEAFGNDQVYIEKYLLNPRHIEIQIMADSTGDVVHFGERDCSIQRRHQKILEEAPSPLLSEELRADICSRAVSAVQNLGYLGAGTLEFLFQDGEFYFIEMNTRIQVEHPVTEMITDIDLVCEQIRVASGEPLSHCQEDIRFKGHAIECRINAESPVDFRPAPGEVTEYHPPGGGGVRVDSALYAGYRVPPFYDSMIGKLIVYGLSRDECLMRLKRSLEEFVVGGIETTLPLHKRLVSEPDFISGNYDIHWLERLMKDQN
jgi:acetyl-CoA carboxylase biotin carboxylase subunit